MTRWNIAAKRLLTMILALTMVCSLTACDKKTEEPAAEPETPVVSDPVVEEATPAPEEAQPEGATLAFSGPETGAVGDELTYTLSIAKTEGFATATFNFELDAATVEEPIVEGLNGFMVISVNFEEVDGKWVGETVMMNLAGMTTEAPMDVAAVYAKAKAAGDQTVVLTDALLSGYVGEDSEDWITFTCTNDSVTTKIA